MNSPNPDDGQDPTSTIVVIVVRTGGIAGMRREWRAEPPPTEERRWIALIDECPWDDESPDPGGADRFVWNIEAHCGRQAKEAKLPDRQVQGPWRDLVDEVRSYDTPTPSPTPHSPTAPSPTAHSPTAPSPTAKGRRADG